MEIYINILRRNYMLTLGTQRDLTNDMLIKGIIDSVITVNQFYQMLPFKGIQGNALAYNREGTADQQALVNTVNTAFSGINKDQQTFTRHSTELTTIIGDAQVNGLVQAVGSDFHDATAVQVAAKAKGLGRRYMNLLIHGNEGGSLSNTSTFAIADLRDLLAAARVTVDGAVVTSTTVLTATSADYVLVPASGTVRSAITFTGSIGALVTGTFTLTTNSAIFLNQVSAVVNGFAGFDGLTVFAGTSRTGDSAILLTADNFGNDVLSRLDEYVDAIHDKDGMVDYIMMNSAGVRKYTQALRATNAAGYDDVMEVKMSSGGLMKVQSYRGVPIFRNDFVGGGIDTNRAGTLGGDTAGNSEIFVGTLDDGSMTHGICGLTALKSSGMQVQKLGAMETRDSDITRVKWYCGLAHFSELGLIKGVL